MKTFTFKFLDGTVATYEADDIHEAMKKRFEEHGSQDWTVVS